MTTRSNRKLPPSHKDRGCAFPHVPSFHGSENSMHAIVPKPKEKSNVIEFPEISTYLNKIYMGDAVETMNKFPASCIDLCVTSPPYNLRNSTGNGMKDGRGGKWKNAELINGYESHDDAMPHDEYVEWQRKCLTAMMRLLKAKLIKTCRKQFYDLLWISLIERLSCKRRIA